jgi:hypothetical protein
MDLQTIISCQIPFRRPFQGNSLLCVGLFSYFVTDLAYPPNGGCARKNSAPSRKACKMSKQGPLCFG